MKRAVAQFWFYRGLQYGDWRNRLIAMASGGQHSHVEIYFPAYDVRLTAHPSQGTIMVGGTIPKDEQYQWDVLGRSYPSDKLDAWIYWMLAHVGYPYDWRGAFGALFPFLSHNPKAFLCSEYILSGMKYSGLYDGPTVITPAKMWHYV